MKWIGIIILILLALFVGLFIVALLSRLIQGFGWWKTPFKRSKLGKYDLFLSYKTEDSEFVRPIADNLIAHGIKVWFAEYSLIAKHSLKILDDKKIDSLCLQGTKNSKWGAFFFNERFSKSKFCKEELKGLQQKHDQLIRIDLLDASGSSKVKNSFFDVTPNNQIHYSSLSDVTEFIGNKLKKDTKGLCKINKSSFGNKKFKISHRGISFQIDFSGWDQSPRNVQDIKSTSRDYVGADLRKRINGRRTILLWSMGPDHSSSTRLTPKSIGIDDRAFRKEMIEFANKFFKDRKLLRPVGVHLIEVEGYYHYIYTYWNWISHSWVRRYSIFLPHPQNPSENWEYIFHFTYYGNFKDYCLSSEYFDQMIKSIKVGPA